MARQATKNTTPELLLRRELHRRGARYRIHLRPEPDLRVTADLVFTKARVAVFVDGCFWHRCPDHGTLPRANSAWWAAKLGTTVARDQRTDDALRRRGWTVVRVWEHTLASEGADTVIAALKYQPAGGS